MPNKEPPVDKQWKKGQSGNPAGKPKGARSLKTLLQEALIKIGEGNMEPYDVLLIKRVMKMAIGDGNEAMIRLVWGYLEGLPVAKVEGDITTNGESINNNLDIELLAASMAKKLKEKKT